MKQDNSPGMAEGRGAGVLAGAGVGLFLLGVLLLSSPGRLDMVDGETRYEAAKSLALHGDMVVRGERAWFNVFPGREGEKHTLYRLPPIVLGAGLIAAARGLGFMDDPSLHVAFAMVSPLMGALLGVLFVAAFRSWGLSPRACMGWALAGILCTPLWYYGTSVFDEEVGAVALVGAVLLAMHGAGRGVGWAVWTGMAFGGVFLCKPPLAVFGLMAAGWIWRRVPCRRRMVVQLMWLGLGFVVTAAVQPAVDAWNFPPETRAQLGEMLKGYLQPWPGHWWMGMAALLFSPGASIFLYHPALLAGVSGTRDCERIRGAPKVCLWISVAVFFVFISSLSFFKGDPAWGPRYVVPVFALLWLFAPRAALRRPVWWGMLLLGLVVQAGSLAVDPQRLYLKERLPNAATAVLPELLFFPRASHLLARPGEILECRGNGGRGFAAFAPVDPPTAAPPMAQDLWHAGQPENYYAIFGTFRPWWWSYRYLDRKERPVPVGAGVAWCGGMMVVGAGLGVAAARRGRRPR